MPHIEFEKEIELECENSFPRGDPLTQSIRQAATSLHLGLCSDMSTAGEHGSLARAKFEVVDQKAEVSDVILSPPRAFCTGFQA